MQEEALQQFLSSVRCERFIDYLDPIGETAEEALARRVRWARMTRNDPAHADEAMFLLEHERDLRSLLLRELDASKDWAEETNPGEASSGSRWATRSGENSAADPQAETGHEDVEEFHDALRTGIMRMEDITLDGDDPAPPPVDVSTLPPTTATLSPGLVQTRGKVRTASPARRRVAAPTLSSALEMPSTIPVDSLDTQPTAPRRTASALARAIAEAASNTPAPEAATDPAARPRERVPPPVGSPAASPSPSEDTNRSRGVPMVWVGGATVAAAALLAAWALLPTSSPEPRDGGRIVARVEPVRSPAPVETRPSSVAVADEPSREVAPPTRSPVDRPAAVDGSPSGTTLGDARAAAEPAKERMPATPAEQPPTPDEPGVPEEAAPERAEPAESKEVAPEHQQPEERKEVAPKRDPEERIEGTAGTGASGQARPTVEGAPAPRSGAASGGPTHEAVAGSAAVALRGLWGGTIGTGADARGLLLRVQSQQGASFTGTVELLDQRGASIHTVTGRFEGGELQFGDGSGLRFTGRLQGDRISGTLLQDGAELPWSVRR